MRLKRKSCPSVFLSAIMLFAFLPAIEASAADTAELIKNGGFENSVSNWTLQGDAGLSSDLSHSGNFSIRLTGSDTVISQRVYLYDNEEYNLSLYMRTGQEKNAMIKIEFITEGNIKSGVNDICRTFSVSQTDWTFQSINFTPKQGDVSANLYIVLNENGEIFADDISLQGPAARVGEIIKNGGGELFDAGGLPRYWAKPSYGSFLSTTEQKYSGSYSLKLDNTGTGKSSIGTLQKNYVCQGKGYQLSFAIRTTGSSYGSVKIVFQNSAGEASPANEININLAGIGLSGWQTRSKSFTVQPGDLFATIIFYAGGNGAIYWDDISLTGEIFTFGNGPEPIPAENIKEPYKGTSELLTNTGFEILDSNNNIADWYISGYKNYISASTEKVFSGQRSLKITDMDGSKNPWLRYTVTNIVPGAEYQFAAWIKAECDLNFSDGVGFKAEFYASDGGVSGGDGEGATSGRKTINTAGAWHQVVYFFTAPPGAVSLAFYLRMYGVGTAYMDDVSLCRTSPAGLPFIFSTDNIFYYDDAEQGKASIELHSRVMEIENINFPENAAAGFKLLDGENILKASDVQLNSGKASFEFDLDLLEEKKKEYEVCVAMTDLEGNTYNANQVIYKYDRPTALRKDGIYIKDGQPFDPVIGYHVGDTSSNNGKYLPFCVEAGINVVQTQLTGSVTNLISQLDKIHSYGLMALVCLYANMKPAAHPDNLDTTKKMVEAVKDHPAVFAYALMDEPSVSMESLLIESYKAVREIDTRHPTYIVNLTALESMARYSDIFNIDEYSLTEYGPNTKSVTSATSYKKPIYTLLPAYRPGTHTIDAIRYTAYDSFMEGAKAIGYYCIQSDTPDGPDLPDTDLGSGIKAFYQSGELRDAYRYFVHSDYPTFSQCMNEDVRWKCFIKGSKFHIVILNRTNTVKDVAIPLVNSEGTAFISGFEGRNIAGSETAKSDGSTFSVSVPPYHASVYEITPDNLSAVRNPGFEEAATGNTAACWTTGSGITLNNTDKKSGKSSLQLQSGGDLCTWQPVKLSPNSQYVFSGSYKSVSTSYIKVEFYKDENCTLYIGSYSKILNPSADWNCFEERFSAPGADMLYAKIFLGKTSGTVLFDDITLNPDVSSISYTEADGEIISDLRPGKITVNYHHVSATDNNVTMSAALYSLCGTTRRLESIDIKTASSSNLSPADLKTEIEVLDDGRRYMIKTFVWDSLTKMAPYSKAYLLRQY